MALYCPLCASFLYFLYAAFYSITTFIHLSVNQIKERGVPSRAAAGPPGPDLIMVHGLMHGHELTCNT